MEDLPQDQESQEQERQEQHDQGRVANALGAIAARGAIFVGATTLGFAAAIKGYVEGDYEQAGIGTSVVAGAIAAVVFVKVVDRIRDRRAAERQGSSDDSSNSTF